MEEIIKKVEEVLNSLECGFKFTKHYYDDGVPYYVCTTGTPIVYAGMTFDDRLCVQLNKSRDGWLIEYQCSWNPEETSGPRTKVIEKISQNMKISWADATRVYDKIIDILEINYDAVFYQFGPEFEKRLLDVKILDRLFWYLAD